MARPSGSPRGGCREPPGQRPAAAGGDRRAGRGRAGRPIVQWSRGVHGNHLHPVHGRQRLSAVDAPLRPRLGAVCGLHRRRTVPRARPGAGALRFHHPSLHRLLHRPRLRDRTRVQLQHCVTPCTGTTICPASAPHCEGDVGFCVACDESGTISEDGLPACGTTGTSGPICNRAIGQCVACLVDSSCGGSTPRCNTYAGKCVACLSSADCTTAAAPVCDPVSNQCVP